jgi:hypothetical protein
LHGYSSRYAFEMFEEKEPRIAFITCITNGYDSTLKEPVKQTYSNVSFIAYCDKDYRVDPIDSQWNIRDLVHHANERSLMFRNSIENNKHSFNIAKYYKCMFWTFPELNEFDVVVWLDGSIQITNPNCALEVMNIVYENGLSPLLFKHEYRSCFIDESIASHMDRYTSTFWNNQSQPYQDVDAQAQQYMQVGCPENFGLWITCFVAWNMRNPLTPLLLQSWYQEILVHTTQDQISFPFVMWRHNMAIYTLPGDNAHDETIYYKKLSHGT